MISDKYKQFRMGFNYKLAEEIISLFNSENITEEIDSIGCLDCIDAAGIIRKVFEEGKNAVLKPDKHTLLHCFCEQYLYYYLLNERWFLLDGICDDFDAGTIINYISRTEKILHEYGVKCRDYQNEILSFHIEFEESDYTLDNEYKELISEIFDEMLGFFDDIEKDIIDATIYILYDNKEFLFKFNKYISQFVSKAYLPLEDFDEYNHIKRCRSLPKWLKRAVFYRDRGRCQHCGKDLTGQLAINDNGMLQYDHIIPIEKGGTNDATNFQILCNECNSKKGGKLYFPNYFYQMYW